MTASPAWKSLKRVHFLCRKTPRHLSNSEVEAWITVFLGPGGRGFCTNFSHVGLLMLLFLLVLGSSDGRDFVSAGQRDSGLGQRDSGGPGYPDCGRDYRGYDPGCGRDYPGCGPGCGRDYPGCGPGCGPDCPGYGPDYPGCDRNRPDCGRDYLDYEFGDRGCGRDYPDCWANDPGCDARDFGTGAPDCGSGDPDYRDVET
ncbi:hypothetical protein ALC62_07603 [Cyphomyrmex costatus]|uniref:Uncharacterized protein n=1 Tax=Cyphomyrmex costatus TaxID=456900 RepID=A0A195CLN0_9HYME|nr:hypothetical protein ALC62_07603 [Cyphomyrmex costatus]